MIAHFLVEAFVALAWGVGFSAGVFALALMPRHWRLWLLGLATLPVVGLVIVFGFDGFAGLAAAIVGFGYCLYPTFEETERDA
jgi:hypothetical protein